MVELDLKQKTISGLFYKLIEKGGAQLVSFIVSLVVARILIPEDYAIVGIVNIFITFGELFITSGFNIPLIQKKDADIKDYSSVMMINIFLSIIFYTVLFLCAPLIARVYKKEILINVIRILGVVIIINSMLAVVGAYVSNTLNFKISFIASLITNVISGIVGIVMAIRGFGVYALVAQSLIGAFIKYIILVNITKFKFNFRIYWNRARELFSYGSKIFLATIIGVVYEETYPLVIGLKYSTDDLAFYSKGKNFPYLISSTISETVSAVLLPVMSKEQDNIDNLLNYTRKFIQVTSYIIFPIMIGLMAISDNLILVLLTEKWIECSVYVKIFSFSYMMDIIQNGNLQVIRALGKGKLLLKMEVMKKVSYFIVIAIFLFLTKSAKMVAMASVVCSLIATIVNTNPNRKLIGYSYKKQIEDFLPNFVCSSLMGFIVYMFNFFSINPEALILIQFFVGVISYFVLSLVTHNNNLKVIIAMAKDVLKRGNE